MSYVIFPAWNEAHVIHPTLLALVYAMHASGDEYRAARMTKQSIAWDSSTACGGRASRTRGAARDSPPDRPGST